MPEYDYAEATICSLERFATALGVTMSLVLAYATDIERYEATGARS